MSDKYYTWFCTCGAAVKKHIHRERSKNGIFRTTSTIEPEGSVLSKSRGRVTVVCPACCRARGITRTPATVNAGIRRMAEAGKEKDRARSNGRESR